MNAPATSAIQAPAPGAILLSEPASGPVSTEPEWPPGGEDLRDVALPLRFMLASGTPVAIATVVGARGTALRRPGSVVVVTESGETLGFNPSGPLDKAIKDLAADALAAGRDRLDRLDIDHEAASYIGLSGGVSLDIHATRVRAGDPMFASALRYLDSGAASVLAVGTRGVSGHAVIGADRITGQLSWPVLPAQVITDARSMLSYPLAVRRTYHLAGESGGASVQVWMQSHPAR